VVAAEVVLVEEVVQAETEIETLAAHVEEIITETVINTAKKPKSRAYGCH
jgi:hypothetical protein